MSKESQVVQADTKTMILDAAERLFAEVGFAVSLRQIIALAGVNLAAVHYHFGSKEALIVAVFARRIEPINAERLRLLEACEAEAGAGPLPVEEVLNGLLSPAMQLAREPDHGGRNLRRLFGRMIAEPSEELQKLFFAQFAETARRFTAAFQRALPGLTEKTLLWRVQFVIGTMAHVLCDPHGLKTFSHGLCDPANSDEALRQMVRFLAAGLRAPCPESVSA